MFYEILLLDLAGWPALPGGWWLCAVGRPTQKRPYLQVFYFEGLVGNGKTKPTSTMTAWGACREDRGCDAITGQVLWHEARFH
jgi:hypothetical protein